MTDQGADTHADTGVERRGLDRICAERAVALFGVRAESETVRAGCRAAVAAVLSQPELDPEESAALAAGDTTDAGLLEVRLRRALRAGIEAAAQALGEESAPAAPSVAVVIGPSPETASRLAESVGQLGTRGSQTKAGAEAEGGADSTGSDARPASGPALVLADGEGYEGLRAALVEGGLQEPGTETAVFRGDLLEDTGSPTGSSTSNLEVFLAAAELSELAQRMRAASTQATGEDVGAGAPRPAPDDDDELGERLVGEVLGGKYRIDKVLGEGGFGTVYVATDTGLDTLVAVKVLKRATSRSPGALADFLSEAKLLTKLDHPNIVRWITFSTTDDGLHYFVMEFLRGEELSQIMRREGPVPAERALNLLLQVLAALKQAHHLAGGQALLHLDLKPQNVYVLPPAAEGDEELAKVIDFGIGQHIGAEVRAAEAPVSAVEEETLTTGEFERSIGVGGGSSTRIVHTPDGRAVRRARGGTLLYASPEQCKHLAGHQDIVELDGRSDLYSFGILAFQLLTGKYPFRKPRSVKAAIANHLEVQPIRVLDTGVKVPKRLAAFVDRCLVKDRDGRWPDTREAYAALNRIAHPERSLLIALVPTVLVIAAFAGWFFFGRSPEVPVHLLRDRSDGLTYTTNSIYWASAEGMGAALELQGFEGERDELELRVIGEDGAVRAEWEASWVASPPATRPESDEPPPGDDERLPEDDEAAPEDDEAHGSALAFSLRPVSGVQPSAEGDLRVEVLEGSAPVARSFPFHARAVPDWRLVVPRVPSNFQLGRVAPRGQTLRVEAESTIEGGVFTSVRELVLTTRSLDGELLRQDAFDWNAERAEFDVPLDPLGGLQGPVSITFEARDLAGARRANPEPIELVLAGPFPELAPGSGFVLPVEGRAPVPLDPNRTVTFLGPEHALRLASTQPALAVVTVRDNAQRVVGRPWTSLLGSTEEGGADAESLLELVPLADLMPRDRSVDGTLQVELKEDAVYRVTGERYERTYTIQYFPGQPEIDVVLTRVAEDGAPLEGSAEQLYSRTALRAGVNSRATPGVDWNGRAQLTVRDARTKRPHRVRLTLLDNLAEVSRELVASEEMGSGLAVDVPLQELTDGIWTIDVEFLDDLLEADTTEEGDATRAPRAGEAGMRELFDFVVDTSPPRLAWKGFDVGSAVDLGTLRAGAVLDIQLEDPFATSGGISFLEWELQWNGKESWPLRATDAELAEGRVGAWASFDDEERADGDYLLFVYATDQAQNRSEELFQSWTWARVDPVAELVLPRARGNWVLERDEWNVEAKVQDGNGIAAVEARFTNLETLESSGPYSLARVPDSDRWFLAEPVRADHRWSGAMTELSLVARDNSGAETTLTKEARLGQIVPDYRPRVLLGVADGSAQDPVPFARVLGTADRRAIEGPTAEVATREASYSLDGAELPAESAEAIEGAYRITSYFGSRETGRAQPRFWLPPGVAESLDTYYLDERVVSAEEYLRFLDAEQGWSEARHWPGGRVPGEPRRAELRTELERLLAEAATLASSEAHGSFEPTLASLSPAAGEAAELDGATMATVETGGGPTVMEAPGVAPEHLPDPEAGPVPATGVTWSEATAYARWLGKRLPTLLELDEAARRATAGAREDEQALAHLDGTWDDLAEWTATPECFVGSEVDRRAPRAAYTDLPEWFLATPDLRGEVEWSAEGRAGVRRVAYTRGQEQLEVWLRSPEGRWVREAGLPLPSELGAPIALTVREASEDRSDSESATTPGQIAGDASEDGLAAGEFRVQSLVVYGLREGRRTAHELVLDRSGGGTWSVLSDADEPAPPPERTRYWVSGCRDLTTGTLRGEVSSARLLPSERVAPGVGFRCALSGVELLGRPHREVGQ